MFLGALQSMGLTEQEVIVVGDDVTSDILGATESGLKGFLVTTGKFTPEQIQANGLSSECLIRNISDVIALCK